jgi:hypothetical protein
MQLSLDRIENGIAVLVGREDETFRLTLPVAVLPEGCREGDILTLVLERDPKTTREVRTRVAGRIADLQNGRRSPGS